jgi:hypothetical protein
MIGFLRRCGDADRQFHPPRQGLRRFPPTPQGYSADMKLGLAVMRSSTICRGHNPWLVVAAAGEPQR